MTKSPYSTGLYRDQDTGRTRWAVLDAISNTWYFAAKRGKIAAEKFARRLNQEAI